MEGKYLLSPFQASKFQLLNTKSNKVPIRTNELYKTKVIMRRQAKNLVKVSVL